MRSFRTSLAAVLLGLPLILSAQAAEDRKIIERTNPDGEPRSAQEFLVRAIACSVAEVKFAEKAEKNAASDEVRQLARSMAEDHKKIRDDLMEQAKKMKVAVVEGLEKKNREEYDRLSKLEGAAFDREYVRYVVESHEKGIEVGKKWAKDAKDAELRNTTENAVKKMQDHLEHAKKVQAKIKN